MELDFTDLVNVASDPAEEFGDFTIARKGVENLYDIFQHFSDGGTIHNYDYSKMDGVDDANEARGVLAIAWLNLRDISLME